MLVKTRSAYAILTQHHIVKNNARNQSEYFNKICYSYILDEFNVYPFSCNTVTPNWQNPHAQLYIRSRQINILELSVLQSKSRIKTFLLLTSSQCQIGRNKLHTSVNAVSDIEFARFYTNTRTPAENLQSPNIKKQWHIQNRDEHHSKTLLFLSKRRALVIPF
jgi:hypothetical protein